MATCSHNFCMGPQQLEIGYQGEYQPIFYTNLFVKRNSNIGSNPWLIQRGLHHKKNLLRATQNYLKKEQKMKVEGYGTLSLAERERRKEFTISPSEFPKDAPKKTLSTKAREGEETFSRELHVVTGDETAEQGITWIKKFEETFINGREEVPWDKMETWLTALTKDKAQTVVTNTYSTLRAIPEAPYSNDLFSSLVVDHPLVQDAMKRQYSSQRLVNGMIASDDFKKYAC